MMRSNRDSSKNVILLGIVSFLNDFSSEMIAPILPMFITFLGGSGVVVGLIGGLRDSISSLLKVVCGFWSDRRGRRKIFVVSGYSISICFKLLLSFARSWPAVMIFASLERIGKGLRTAPRDAIIADSLTTKRGKGFGIHRAFDTLGAVCGSVAVLLLFWYMNFGYTSVIFLAAVIAAFSLLPLRFVYDKGGERQDVSFRLSMRSLPKSLKLFIIVSGLFSLSNFSYMFFVLRAQSLFQGRLSLAAPILLYVFYNIFYSALSIPFGMLSDRFGKKEILLIGYSIFSVVCLGFTILNRFLWFVVLFVLYGIVQAAIDGNQRAFVSDLSYQANRATALGVYHTVEGFLTLPASLIAGILWQGISYRSTFLYGMCMSLFSVLIFISLFGYIKKGIDI